MSLEKRSKVTINLCNQMRELAKDGIRLRHPDYNEEQVHLALIHLTAGSDLFAYPGIEIEP